MSIFDMYFAFIVFLLNKKRDSIPIGCVPPARWPPLDVSTSGGVVGPQANKFEQVSSNDYQMSVAAGVRRVGPMSVRGERERG